MGEDELTNLKVNEFLVWLKNKGAGDFYRHNNARTIKTFMKCMAKQYDIPNPDFAMPIIHKKKKLYLEYDQIQSLLKSDLSDREIIIIRLLISTGIRLSELIDLNWEDINFKSGLVNIKNGKGGKFRFVVTDKKTLILLLRYKNKNDCLSEDSVITTILGERYQRWGLTSTVIRIRNRTGIYITAHALRRTFARQAVMNGMGIEWVQQLMGHESLEMTKAYVGQLDILDVAKAYNKNVPLNF